MAEPEESTNPVKRRWATIAADETLDAAGGVTSRTDWVNTPRGPLYRTIVTVRKGVDIVSVSVAMAFAQNKG